MAQEEEKQFSKFDSSRNWSIMIRESTNQIRNEVMRCAKKQQVKRTMLHSIRFNVQKEIRDERAQGGGEE